MSSRLAMCAALLVLLPASAGAQEPVPAGAPAGGGLESAPLALPSAHPLMGFHEGRPLLTGTGQPGDAGSGVSPQRAADDMAGAGASVARASVLWSAAEPVRGSFDEAYLAKVRRYAHALAERGIKFVAVVGDAPPWARTRETGEGWDVLRDEPSLVDSYAAFVARVARELGPQLAAIEIWNEPNSSVFWGDSAPSPGLYARMLRASTARVRALAAGDGGSVPVLLGSLLGVTQDVEDGRNRYVWAQRFLLQLHAAGLGPGDYDAVGIHVYPAQPEGGVGTIGEGSTTAAILADLRAGLATLHSGGPPARIWVTETGVSTADVRARTACGPLLACGAGTVRFGETPAGQARWVQALVRKLGSDPGIDAVLVHALYEGPGAPNDFETGFGLVDVQRTADAGSTFSYRPAWCALRALRDPAPREAASGCPAAPPLDAPRLRGKLRHRRTLVASTGDWGPGAPPLRVRWLRCETRVVRGCKPTSAGLRYKARTPDVGRYVAIRVQPLAGPPAVLFSRAYGPVRRAAAKRKPRRR